jgi:hypothetical protein
MRAKASRDCALIDPLVAEIVEAPLALGGQAHRVRVMARVIAARVGSPPVAALRAHLQLALDLRLALDHSDPGRPALFLPPPAKAPHRSAWAREAQRFLRQGRVSSRSAPHA